MGMEGNGNDDDWKNGNGNEVLSWERVEMGISSREYLPLPLLTQHLQCSPWRWGQSSSLIGNVV